MVLNRTAYKVGIHKKQISGQGATTNQAERSNERLLIANQAPFLTVTSNKGGKFGRVSVFVVKVNTVST